MTVAPPPVVAPCRAAQPNLRTGLRHVQEAVSPVRVKVCSDDFPGEVDGTGDGGRRARKLNRGERTAARSKEALLPIRAKVESNDRPKQVDVLGGGVARARGIDRCETARGGAQVAVISRAAWVNVHSSDRTLQVDGGGDTTPIRTFLLPTTQAVVTTLS